VDRRDQPTADVLVEAEAPNIAAFNEQQLIRKANLNRGKTCQDPTLLQIL
jgi:hypothetical protein